MPRAHGEPLRVARLSGFGVNRVGVAGVHSTGFPLSFSATRSGGVVVAHGTAAQATEIADVVFEACNPRLLIFDVGHHVYDKHSQQVPMATIAAEQAVPATARDISWSSRGAGAPSELLVIAQEDLGTLLAEVPLYDIVIADAPALQSDDEQDEMILAIKARDPAEAPWLAQLPKSSVVFDGHDDCYFYVESRDEDVSPRLLARLLGLLAGSTLVDERDGVDAHEPPSPLARWLLDKGGAWVAWPLRLQAGVLTIGLRAEEWDLSKPFPDVPAETVAYDPTSGDWEW